jgi:RNA polymerase sigma-70 factor (ECF subfamily)
MIQDKVLVMRFNRGDTQALRDIYTLYKDELVSLAAALLHDRTTAEDTVHDLFARLIARQDTLRIAQDLRRYLLTAVANGARQRYHARKRDPATSLDAATMPEIETTNPPDAAAQRDEERQCLVEALSALPYEQREVVLLRHFSGLKFHRIASLQGVSINTVQGRYRYGLDKLRSLLNGRLP